MNTPSIPGSKVPFTIQAARAAWLSPLLGVGGLGFAGTAAQDPNHGWITAIVAGLVFVVLVLCGLAFTVMGFAAAIFDPANRRSLLANSFAGLVGPVVFGGFLALMMPFYGAAQDVSANKEAWDIVNALSRDDGPTEDRYERSAAGMRIAADAATGESARLLADVASAMEELVDTEREKTEAWGAFLAAGGVEGAGVDWIDDLAERRALLAEARAATLRWQTELRAVDAWLTPSIHAKTTVAKSRREWLELNTVRGPLDLSAKLLDQASAFDARLATKARPTRG